MPDLIKVAKFGGTSMADAKAMRRCAEIIIGDPDKKLIVVSATSGTTNLLTQICESQIDIEIKQLLKEIRSKHLAICDDLKKPDDVRSQITLLLLDELEAYVSSAKLFKADIQDEVLSFGERLSSTLFTHILKEKVSSAKWVDAREVMITDDVYGNAEPNVEQIAKQAKEKWLPLFKNHCLVTQGFIGAEESGNTTTLGRGGSDYSAALFAEGIEADVLEIWTDVSAVYTTDPRIVKDARPITEISFDEAAELSVFGAKVLHPATLKPAIRKRIKVYVGSSINPEQPGTWIVKETKSNPVIRAISPRRNQTLLNVHSLDMLHRSGFLARLFEMLAKYKISVDLVTTSEVSVSLTLDTDIQSSEKNKLTPEVLDELRTFSEVSIDRNLSLIALVGNNLHATAGLSGPVFGALQDINIRLICHGASSHNLCFLVNEDQAEEVCRFFIRNLSRQKQTKPRMKVSVIGTGKTGSAVVEVLGQQAVPFDSENQPTVENLNKTDIAIIFVPGSSAEEIVDLLLKAKIPAVWGTTGYEWPSDLNERVIEAGIPWIIGSNFSLGMNLVRKSLELFGAGSSMLDNAEFHIHETHHVHKKDAPSGTALSWKEWLGKESTISSSREGDVKGIHELHIKTENESIFLKHEAHSRKLFAEGAIWAAHYLLENTSIKPGVYPFATIFDQAFKKQ